MIKIEATIPQHRSELAIRPDRRVRYISTGHNGGTSSSVQAARKRAELQAWGKRK